MKQRREMIFPDWHFIRREARAALLSFYAPLVELAAALGQFKKSTSEEERPLGKNP